MSDDEFELVHGSGNVYRDLKRPHPDLEQARALMAAQIVRILDMQGLSTRDAEAATGVRTASSPASATHNCGASPSTA